MAKWLNSSIFAAWKANLTQFIDTILAAPKQSGLPPRGQVSPPRQSGYCPRKVGIEPPRGQDTRLIVYIFQCLITLELESKELRITPRKRGHLSKFVWVGNIATSSRDSDHLAKCKPKAMPEHVCSLPYMGIMTQRHRQYGPSESHIPAFGLCLKRL